MTSIRFLSVGPLTSIQDGGRFGALEYGIAASGPMDRGAFIQAHGLLFDAGHCVGSAAIECAAGRMEFTIDGGPVFAAFCGALFDLLINGIAKEWGAVHRLVEGDRIEITPGVAGNYAFVRMNHDFDFPKILGSQATNTIANLGGANGQLVKAGDVLQLTQSAQTDARPIPAHGLSEGPFRLIWGVHAEQFSAEVREKLLSSAFVISPVLDRMGVRLRDVEDVFLASANLSLVSDAIVPGDIQILGDGTPVVLMRDHQSTGGYPRIATLLSADMDRFSQMRPGSEIRFISVSVEHAHRILRSGGEL